MTNTITDKTVLVTGANRGIGKNFVESLIKQGAKKVYAAVRNMDSVQSLIEAYGDKIVAVHLDLTQPETILAAAAQATDVDIVINNAGVLQAATPLSDNATAALSYELEVNTFGLIRVAQAFANTLEANQGVLVQLNSVASIKNFSDFTTYSASKAASYSITQGLKDSFAEKGVTVISVHPGPIATDMADAAGLKDVAQDASVISQKVIEAIEANQFHVFPDEVAQHFAAAYQSYAENVIEAPAQSE